MHRKKILVLTSTFPRWIDDTEPSFVFNLCERLSTRFDVSVLAPHAPRSKDHEHFGDLHVVRYRYFFDWGESLAYQGGIIANLRKNRLRYMLVPLFLVSQTYAMWKLLKQEDFDLVHAHWLIPQGLSAVTIKCISTKFPVLVCTAHGSDLHGLKGAIFSVLKRWVIKRSNALTTVSAAMRKMALTFAAKSETTTVISMGVDTKRVFTPDTAVVRGRENLLFVGRLVKQKGLDLLIYAIRELISAAPNCKLTVIGDGPERESLQGLTVKLGIEGNVEFVGAISNGELSHFYRKAAMLICPSMDEEGFGLVVAEAMACECPVIAADLLAIRELVKNEITGMLFQRGNGDELVRVVRSLFARPEKARSLGMAGRQYVQKNFDWDYVAQKYGDLFERTMDQKV